MRKLLTYQIKQGDTLTSIAADFRVSTAALIQANPSLQTGVIAGQRIVIPGLPDPNTIPYHIAVSIGAKTLTLYQNNQVIKLIRSPSVKY